MGPLHAAQEGRMSRAQPVITLQGYRPSGDWWRWAGGLPSSEGLTWGLGRRIQPSGGGGGLGHFHSPSHSWGLTARGCGGQVGLPKSHSMGAGWVLPPAQAAPAGPGLPSVPFLCQLFSSPRAGSGPLHLPRVAVGQSGGGNACLSKPPGEHGEERIFSK